MKRILLYSSGIIAEKKPTGGELRFLELAAALREQKDAELCCADEEAELQATGLRAALHMKGPEGTPAFLPEEGRILLANRKTLKKIADSDYASVIVFDVPPAIGLTLYRVRNLVLMIRKDLIGYERVKSSGNALAKRIKILYQWICEDLCLRNAKQIICQCAYDRDVLIGRHPLIGKKLMSKFAIQINNCNPAWIVRRAAEADTENSPETAAERDKETEVEATNGKRFRIGFVGGFDDLRKGQELFLKAAAYLTGRYPEMDFLLVGGGRRLEEYRRQYETERIRFYGRMENPLSVMKRCDLLAVPSLADSCPNTVMEALYMGIPVIGSRAGGIPEILRDEDALFSTDWMSLAEKIETCRENPLFLSHLRDAQRARKEELTFDWAEKILELISGDAEQE